MSKIAEPFNCKADPLQYLEQARQSRAVLRDLQNSYRRLVELFETGAPVSSREFAGFIDLAERTYLVNRDGMKASGFTYAVNEEVIRKIGRVEAANAMPSAEHVMMQVDRALRILNRKPGAYNPARSPLYGTALQDWTPLLP